MSKARRAFPVDEARQQLGGISRAKFYELVSQGLIQLTKIGRRSVVTDAAIAECLAKLPNDDRAEVRR